MQVEAAATNLLETTPTRGRTELAQIHAPTTLTADGDPLGRGCAARHGPQGEILSQVLINEVSRTAWAPPIGIILYETRAILTSLSL